MCSNKLMRYEAFHLKAKPQKRIINEKNYTYRLILGILQKYLREAKQVLDIGCGVGTISIYIASKGIRVRGIDISKNSIKTSKLNAGRLGQKKKTEFIQGDFLKVDLKEKYDLVICSEVLEHVKDDKLAIKKIHRSLNYLGKALITVPSKNSPLIRFGFLENYDARVGHLRRYTLIKLTKLLQDEGFECLRIKKTEGIFRNSLFVYDWGNQIVRFANRFSIISDIFTFIDNITLKLFGESQLIVVAQKPKIKGKQ